MKLAIFGGTFDPVHEAHLAVARQAAAKLHLDRMLFSPGGPPSSQGRRYARPTKTACACWNWPATASRGLRFRAWKNTARSYSIDTIRKVRAGLAPGDELFFIIGADAFAEITTWLRWREVLASVRFAVVSRPGHRYLIPEGAQVERLDTLELAISSSRIRGALAGGGRPSDVPPAVLDYIFRHGLYGARVPA